MLEAKQIKKVLDQQVVLHELDMQVMDGSIYGLIGPNGAGKSTLLRVLSGVYQAEEGGVFMDGQAVYDDPLRKCDILLISDDPYYFYNASLADMKSFYKVSYPDFDEELYYRLLQMLELDEKKPLQNFSKGMKRQSFLVLGLAIAPRYLLLDEAFDGLDPHMRLLFKKLIARRIEEKAMSVIISSHNLKEMQEVCDSFGMLEGGKLITSGMLDETLDQVHKIQMAFSREMSETAFQELQTMSIKMRSRIVNIVVKGDIEEIKKYLNTLCPIMMEVLPVSLEEIFVYEMENREVSEG